MGNSHLQKPSASCEARIVNDNEANELRRGRNVKSSPLNGMHFKGFLVPEENNSYSKLNLSENTLRLLNYTKEKAHFLILLSAFNFIEGQLTYIIVIYVNCTM